MILMPPTANFKERIHSTWMRVCTTGDEIVITDVYGAPANSLNETKVTSSYRSADPSARRREKDRNHLYDLLLDPFYFISTVTTRNNQVERQPWFVLFHRPAASRG